MFIVIVEIVFDIKVCYLCFVLDFFWVNYLLDFLLYCLFIIDCLGIRLNYKVFLRWCGNRLICRVFLIVFFFIVCVKFEINYFVSVDLMCREKGKKKLSLMYYVCFRFMSFYCLLLFESILIFVVYLFFCNVLWFWGVENWRF